MAKLKGYDKYNNDMKRNIVTAIQHESKRLIENSLEQSLKVGVDANGNQMPKKKESTKKAYQKNGWNQKDWLVRTGESTKLKIKRIYNGIIFTPKGKDILKHVEKASEWFQISNKTKLQILNLIKARI